MSRSSVYTILSALTQKGLVSTTQQNDIKQFIAQDIESYELLLQKESNHLQKRFGALEEVRKALTQTTPDASHLPNISFFEGQEGLKKVYMTMMRNARKDETLFLLRDEFVWRPEWSFIFEEEWSQRVARIKTEKGIHTKLLVNPSKVEKNSRALYDTKDALEYRFLEQKHSVTNFAMYIMGDTVATMSMEQGNLMGILTINQNIAENQRQIFEGLWDGAE